VPSRKQAGIKYPVGENFDGAAVSPQLVVAPAAAVFGRSVGVLKSKLRSSPVMMLNGRPEAISKMGAIVQPEKNLLAKPLPPSVPL
jgi:hypothetical protein